MFTLKSPNSMAYGNICLVKFFSSIFRYLTGPLVALSVHILVEEVLTFNLSGVASKSDEENVK